MNKLLLLIAITSCSCFSVHSQKIIKGKVLELESNTPISYVNIGIINSSVGTISNSDGTFFIRIPNDHANDSLTFSALGFEPKHIPIQSLQDGATVDIG